MKIRVKKGAVISLLVDTQGNYKFEGAVVSLDENEIVLRQQRFVAKDDVGNTQGFIGYNDINPTITMDGPYPDIHIARERIIGWTYFLIPNSKTSFKTVYSAYFDYKEVENDKLHFYNKGICEGNGDYLE